MEELNTTLLLIIKNNKILLAKKKRGFGVGKFNGVGGKVKKDETIEEAMLRETKEEIGVVPVNYKKVGYTIFDEYFRDEEIKIVMTTFVATDYVGTIQESEEMQPFWFDINNIPYNNMHPDDKYWMPKLLSGVCFNAYFKIDENNKIVKHKIEETTF